MLLLMMISKKPSHRFDVERGREIGARGFLFQARGRTGQSTFALNPKTPNIRPQPPNARPSQVVFEGVLKPSKP